MDWKLSAIKALKGAAVVAVSSLLVALSGAEFTEALNGLAAAIASAIPVIGSYAKGIVMVGLTAGVAAILEGLRNVLKHLNA